MEFGILGPLTVRVGERTEPPRQGRLRTVLALLLLRGGGVVSTDQLVDELWEDDPPATAVNALQVYVSNLRRLLAGGPDPVLVTRRPGYALVVAPQALDLHRFREHASAGRSALDAGDAATAAARLHEGLALWRGPALVDVPGRVLHERFVPAMEEERMAAVELLSRALLDLDRPGDAAARLRPEVALHPLREHLVALLVTALLRDGRVGEARAAHERVCRQLTDELGLDPGPELTALDLGATVPRRMPVPLDVAEPVPDIGFGRAAVPPVRTGDGPSRPSDGRPARRPGADPTRLPPPVPLFTGREAEVDAVVRALSSEDTDTRVVEVTGPGGAGKSALAVHVARLVADRFGDGVLWLSLRGSSEHPASTAATLAALLHALGVDARAVPRSVDERSRLARSRLAGRRVLLVLDDAGGERQVRPLLPAAPGAAVLITGRVRLVGLDGVHTVPLAQLDPADAVRLLVRSLGALRVAADPEAAGRVVRACGRMPLAVRIAAARLAARPQLPLAAFADELGDERRRLDLLEMGDQAVRATIATAYRRCRRPERIALALLARLRPGEVPAWAVAVLLSEELWAGTAVVERLVEAHLLLARGFDGLDQPRYEQHDLVRLFAAEQDVPGAGPAFERLAGVLTALFARAEHAVRSSTAEPPGVVHGAGTGVDDGLLATVDTDPVRWATGELPVALATLELLADSGAPAVAFALARRLTWLLDLRGDRATWASVQAVALCAARATGDPADTAWALVDLGDLERVRSRPCAAVAAYGRARAVLRRSGDDVGAARAELRLAGAYADRGPLRRAEELVERAAAVLGPRGGPSDAAAVLELQGWMHRDRGRSAAAERCLGAAADIAEELGDRRRTATDRAALVGLLLEQDRPAEAERIARECVAIHRALGDRRAETYAQLDRASVDLHRDRTAGAVERLEACALAFSELGDLRASALVLLRLGEVGLREGRVAAAIDRLRAARARFAELAEARGSAAADLALGRAYADVGHVELAAGCLLDAAERFDRIGLARQARIARGEARPLVSGLSAARRPA